MRIACSRVPAAVLGLVLFAACSSSGADDPVGAPVLLASGYDAGLADGAQDGAGDGAADPGPGTDEPDAAAADAAPPDAGPAADATVDPAPGTCTPACPFGFACFDLGQGPQCLADPAHQCATCSADWHCLGGQCALVDGEGPFCLLPCQVGPGGASNCPTGSTCTPGPDGNVCKPDSGSCTCGAGNLDDARPCLAQACAGSQACTAQGWSACDAPGTTVETCNGLDDDCDGLTDDGLAAGLPCLAASSVGTCKGTATCQGAKGWQCDAPVPAAESCNGQDDDCNGQTDEPWLQGGKYVGDEHCGLCGNGCTDAFAHGTGVCQPATSPPHCQLAACDPGYVPGGPGSCVPAPPDCPGCTCTPPQVGKTQPCAVTNAWGTCAGTETCGSQGWQDCSAQVPAAETCNGQDDDCDGLVDDGAAQVGTPCVGPGMPGCPGVWTCAGKAGLACQAPKAQPEVCNGADDDCDLQVDEGFVDPVTGAYLSPAHCGACNTACPLPPGPGHVATCTASAAGPPACGVACKPGFADANGLVLDGCECSVTPGPDLPDGKDQDCDGVDGDADLGVFVAKTGSDTAPGTRLEPVASVAKGVALAKAGLKRDVYVAAGAYTGNVELAAGVSIYGGYGKQFTARDPASYETVLVGVAAASGPAITVRCQGIAGPGLPTIVDGVTVLGMAAQAPGAASYAVHASGCSARFELHASRLVAGDGAPGSAGLPGSNGKAGKGGQSGKWAKDIGHPKCTWADFNPGGEPGGHACGGVDVSGGWGGTAVCPDFNEAVAPPACTMKSLQNPDPTESGGKGNGPGGGAGGAPGGDAYIDPNDGATTKCQNPKHDCWDCLVSYKPLYGEDGSAGASGASGPGGLGCATPGAPVGGAWPVVLASKGTAGLPGAGGGGGGAAGGVEVVGCTGIAGFHDIGGSGGGGGSGGCAGSGGQGGGSGGASFALFVAALPGGTLPVLTGNVLLGGKGGAGGPGGPGGFGGVGGLGGPAGPGAAQSLETFCAYKGGAGGQGGLGGHGGGGGGGCGGPAVLLGASGVPVQAAAAAWQKTNTFGTLGQGGPGGAGGTSAGAAGTKGAAGVALGLAVWP